MRAEGCQPAPMPSRARGSWPPAPCTAAPAQVSSGSPCAERPCAARRTPGRRHRAPAPQEGQREARADPRGGERGPHPDWAGCAAARACKRSATCTGHHSASAPTMTTNMGEGMAEEGRGKGVVVRGEKEQTVGTMNVEDDIVGDERTDLVGLKEGKEK
eukprot:11847864-Alexandrium_andersonii.AAC.1